MKDEVEVCLDTEVENIRNIQERMRETLDISNSQLDNNLRKQVQLQEDLDNKDLALEIDKICFQLRNNSKNIALQPGVENIDASGSEPESWRKFSCKNRFGPTFLFILFLYSPYFPVTLKLRETED